MSKKTKDLIDKAEKVDSDIKINKTMAELPREVKNEVSHRGQAARELLKRSREGIKL